MSKELPEYKKQQAIQAAPITTGFREAYNSMSAVSTRIGEIGMNIAQNAANQMATIKGQEAAEKNPGMELMPAFTESDKHFQKAFEEQAYNGAIYSANNLLQKQYEAVLQKPLNSSSIELFEKNSMAGLEKIMQNVPQGVRAKVKNDLLNSYSVNHFQLVKQLAKKNQQDIIDNFSVQFQQNTRLVAEQSKLGFFSDAESTYKRNLANINSAEQNRTISKAEAFKYKEIAELTYKSGPYIYILQENYKSGEKAALDYIRHFQTNPPSGLTSTQHAAIRDALVDEYRHMALAEAGGKQLKNLEFIGQIKDGSLDELKLPMWEKEVGTEHFLQGMNLLAEKKKKEGIQTELALHVVNNPGSGNALGPENAKDAYKGLLKILEDGKTPGQQMTIKDYESAAKVVNSPDSGFKEQIQRKALSKNPQDVLEAATIINRHDTDPKNNYLTGIDKQAIAIARSFARHSVANTIPLDKILAQVSNDVLNVTPADREARIANHNTRKSEYKDDKDLRRFLAKQTGWDKNKIPDSFLTDYKNALYDDCQLYPVKDYDLAIDSVLNTLMRKTNITKANGFTEIDDFPMELYVNKPMEEVHKEIITDIQKHIPALDKMFKEGQINFTLELVKEEESGDTALYYAPHMYSQAQTDRLHESGVRRANKITKNNFNEVEKQSGTIRTKADPKTGWPTTGGELSYLLIFVPDSTGLPEIIPADSENPLDAIRYMPMPNMKNMSEEELQQLRKDTNDRVNNERPRRVGTFKSAYQEEIKREKQMLNDALGYAAEKFLTKDKS